LLCGWIGGQTRRRFLPQMHLRVQEVPRVSNLSPRSSDRQLPEQVQRDRAWF
jgi:hypothetical protein